VTARSLRRILSREQKVKLALSAVGSIVLGLLDSLAIAIVLPLVDVATGTGANSTPIHIVEDLLGTHNLDSLRVPLSIVLVALFVVKDVGSMCFTWWSATFINTQRVLLSARILERYLTSPYTEMSRRSSAELMRTMDASVLQVFTYTITGLINLTASIFAVATVLVMLFLLAPVPTGALVVYFFIAAWLYLRLVRKRASRAGERLNESSRQGWRTAFAALGGMKEVNLRGSHRHFVDGFRDAQLEGAYAGRSAMVLNILPSYVLEICFISAVGIVMALSSNPTHGNSSALASIALFVAAGFRVLPSITSILSSISSIRIGGDSVEVVAKELDALGVTQESNALQARRSARDAATRPPRSVAWTELTVEDISFTYPDTDEPVLRDVSLTIPRGRSLAVVGPSGAGKTTLVDIILGLHAPQEGRIAIDGFDVTSRPPWWRALLGYVPQDVYILDATLAENVAFDVPRHAIDPARLATALQRAQLDEVVGRLPDGVDTWLGERGVRLSGGQRQRVGIARALYRQPQLLVLDEATSALDNETEHQIAATMRALRDEVTMVIVAHRLSTVRTADQVAFLSGGMVEDIGTFDDLQNTNADFAHLVALGTL
jgi:ABC-type multidrug transport system fused ATPase/permease subunit